MITHQDQGGYDYYADYDDLDDDPYGGPDASLSGQESFDSFGAEQGGADGSEDPDDDMTPEQAKRAAIWRRVRRGCYVAAAAAVIIPALVFIYGYIFWQPPDEAKLLNMKQPWTIQYADGSTMAVIRPQEGREVIRNINDVSPDLVHASLAAEDADFYSNPGFSFQGIMRSVFFMFTGSGVGGGSTITQQFIKLDLDLTSKDPDYVRKVKEIVLAFKLTNERTKDDILVSYLNTAYYGRGANGITEASKAYFDKAPKDLTPSEAAVLAGMVQRPQQNDPRENLDQATKRFNYVADQMAVHGFVSSDQRNQMALPDTRPSKGWKQDNQLTPDQDKIRNQVVTELGNQGLDEGTLERGGYTVKTTIDKAAQDAAVKAIEKQKENLTDVDKSSLVAVEPSTGKVKAYYGDGEIGGWSWVDSPQPPGSSFKPFVALAGLEKGAGIGEEYDGSSPQTIAGTEFANDPSVRCDSPQHCGVREAMTKSVNTVFVNMAAKFGPPAVADAAYAAGIPHDYGKGALLQSPNGTIESGIALGMYPTKPVDMASAYGTLANEGKHMPHYMVESATSKEGQALNHRVEKPTTLFNEAEDKANDLAWNVLQTMGEVANHSNIPINRPIMTKTGTNQFLDTTKNQNAWTIGGTPQIMVAVAMSGSDQGRPAPLADKSGASFYGAKYPGHAWQEFLQNYLKGKPVVNFKPGTPIGKFQDTPPPPPPAPSTPPTSTTTPPETTTQPTTTQEKPGNGNGSGSGDNCGGLFQPQCGSSSSPQQPTTTKQSSPFGWGNN